MGKELVLYHLSEAGGIGSRNQNRTLDWQLAVQIGTPSPFFTQLRKLNMKFEFEISEDKLLDSVVAAITEDTYPSVVTKIRDSSNAIIEQRVREMLDTHIETQILNMLTTKGFQPTDSYGKPKGEPLTLEDLAIQAASDFLNTKVDDYGRPDKHNKSRMQRYIHEYAIAGLDKSIKSEIDKIKADAIEKTRALVADMMAKKIEG